MNNSKKIYFTKIIFSFLCVFFLLQNVASAEIAKCPKYVFRNNLVQGSRGEDVRLLQEILNADSRTQVAFEGVGSPGSESNLFGRSTRESLKRFQALFIEYVDTANGKLNNKTLTVINAVCQGPFFSGDKTKKPFEVSPKPDTPKIPEDTTSPVVALSSIKATNSGVPFRVYLGASEPIKTPTIDGLILTGATAQDVRKINKTTYSFLVTANADAKDKITVQVEADAVADLAGNKNENASNELVVVIIKDDVLTTSTDTLPTVELPNITTSSTTTATDCSSVSSVASTDYSNPCYGKVPFTNTTNQAGTSEEKKNEDQNQLMQILQGVLKGLFGLGGGLGGGQDAGGAATAPGVCACTGEPTILLAPQKGCGGRAQMGTNPGIGSYVGKSMPPHFPCGQALVNGKCINPQNDSFGMPVTCSVGTPWQWGGGF